MKIESIDDNVAGSRYVDVSPWVVAGISAVINPGCDYPTRRSLRYDGISTGAPTTPTAPTMGSRPGSSRSSWAAGG